MVPRKGNVLGEMDFSGAEISTSCYFHKDPVFIEYQTEGGGDMHKDAAAEILKLKATEVLKQMRQATKSVWTFAQFYGSYYVSCAKKGWEEYPLLIDNDGNPLVVRGMEIGDYMNKTFGSYQSFENHLKKFQDKFWNEWFKVYTKWKDTICDFYIKHGYVETPLGFRFKGLMDRNKCTNYPIQGSSFHLLLYTIIEVRRILKKKGMKTLIIGQIHDSLVLDIPVNEIKKVAKILKKVVGSLHKVHKWMDFPMGLDFEISAPYEKGGTFAAMTKYDM
jgi:DNA polymerase-1